MDIEQLSHLLFKGYFSEVLYFGLNKVLKKPDAQVHMLTGVACCGLASPLANAQRSLEGAPWPKSAIQANAVSPGTELPYEGLFHLITALRLDPAVKAPSHLHEVFDRIATDLTYVSRREIRRSPDRQLQYSHHMTCITAALLLKKMIGKTTDELPNVPHIRITLAQEILNKELQKSGGDAAFLVNH